MEWTNQAFMAYEDETGEAYFCPVDAGAAVATEAGLDLDECVEASTAGRYSGNLNVVGRFNGKETVL